ncbi:MAG: Peptidase Do [Acidobacteriaceae bacterium]|nr:Peptidase Do [Acidobacteriaceae bacterium]
MNGFSAKLRAHRVASTLIIFATLVFGILIGTIIQKGVKGKESSPAEVAQLTMPAPQQMSSAFSKVAKTIEPAVVNINTESTVKMTPRGRRSPGGGNGDDEGSMQDFFDRFFGGQGGVPGQSPEGTRQRSLGSGVIVDSKGYIVTNAHVVEKADRVRVQLAGDPPGVQYDAKVIGSDRETDLAVIKIEPKKALPFAKLGNSDSLDVGDWVLAIGSPFGLDQTVTAGIISSKGRNIDNSHQFQSFLQTDAAINPGNSGGPLVNMNSEVVGINTAIFTQSMGSQGVGFAMPSKTVAEIYNQLISPEHKVTRGSIGVMFNAAPNPAVARVYGVSSGVTIASITPDGPAEAAGLKTGDTIVSVDGTKIKDGNELVNDISSRKPGSKVKLEYVRGGKENTASVTIADRAKLFRDRASADDEDSSGEEKPTASKMGLSVRNLTSDMADRLNMPSGKGVVVTEVKPGSFAEDVGLNRGDLILEVNRAPVNNEDDFRKLQANLKSGQDVVFLVRQGGRGAPSGTIFLGGTLP